CGAHLPIASERGSARGRLTCPAILHSRAGVTSTASTFCGTSRSCATTTRASFDRQPEQLGGFDGLALFPIDLGMAEGAAVPRLDDEVPARLCGEDVDGHGR